MVPVGAEDGKCASQVDSPGQHHCPGSKEDAMAIQKNGDMEPHPAVPCLFRTLRRHGQPQGLACDVKSEEEELGAKIKTPLTADRNTRVLKNPHTALISTDTQPDESLRREGFAR